MDVMLLVETLEQDEGRPQFVIDAVLLTITTVQVIMTINGEWKHSDSDGVVVSGALIITTNEH